jgi:hypothetical protein
MQELVGALQKADAAGNTADAQAIAQMIRQARQQERSGPTDSAFGYSVDRAQQMFGKGVEVVGDLVGSDTVKGIGSGIVAQQEKDIQEGGYKPTYTGSLADTYEDGGISAALGWIGEKTAENAASGGAAIAGTGLAALTAPFSLPAAAVLSGTTIAGSALMGAGETAMEQEEKTGQYDSAVASGVGVLIGILDRFGAGKVIPKSKLANMTGEQVVEELIKKGKPNAAAAIGRRIAGSTVGEAGTELSQEAAIVGSTAAMGGEYTPDELIDRAIDTAAIGGTIGGGTRTAIETGAGIGRGVRSALPGGYTPTDPEAAADVAQRIQQAAQENDFDVNNVSNATDAKGARAAVDLVHTRLVSDIDQTMGDIKNELKPKDSDSDQVRADKAAVTRARKQARTKTKTVVGKAEMEATQRLLGASAEGQQLVRLFRQSNELTELHNRGYVGGLSQFTDALSPLPTNTGYSNRALIELPTRLGLSGAAAGVTGGASIPAQLGAVAAGRTIDKVTGRRSNVAKFLRDQQQQGTQQPTAPSLRAGRALAEAEEQQRKLTERQNRQAEVRANTRAGAAPTPGSVQDTVEQATGLDRRGVADILNIMERIGVSPTMQKTINEYRISVDRGGRISNDMLSPLIQRINVVVDTDPRLQQKMVRERVRDDSPEPQNRDQAREKGKADNQKVLNRERRAINDDNSIPLMDKAILQNALTELGTNLGPRPLEAALEIVAKAEQRLRQPELAEKHLLPYVERIARQQRNKTNAAAA